MAQPTQWLDKPQFDELLALQGGTLPIYKIVAIPFDPEGTAKADPGIRVMMLNVHEPRLYRDEEKTGFVVLPIFEELTYQQLSDAHTIKDAWCYRFTAIHYDSDWPLDKAKYFFKDETLEAFDLENKATH